MTQTFDDKFYLGRIIEDLEFLEKRFCSSSQFQANRLLALGLIKCSENVGEGCSKLSTAFRDANPSIPWSTLVHTRNLSVHEYYRYDYAKGWRQINKMRSLLPEFRKVSSYNFLQPPLGTSTVFSASKTEDKDK